MSDAEEWENELTPKQRAFVREYLIDLNATQAAIRAGYAEVSASAEGSRLLGNVKVAAAVEAAMKSRAERTDITADRVLKELAKIGFSDLRNVFTEGGHLRHPSTWDDATAAAISSIKVVTRPAGGVDEDGNKEVEHVHEIKLWDKNSALEKLAKHLGMFVERHEHTGKDGGPIEMREVSDLDRAKAMAFLASKAKREVSGKA